MNKLFLPLIAMTLATTQISFAEGVDKAPDAATLAAMPRVAVPQPPFLFVNPQEIQAAKNLAQNEEWAKELKEKYVRIAEEWAARDYDFLQKIIPPRGSLFIYGLGLNLDPVQKKRMTWRGWSDPRHVEGADGAIYPNATHPDSGNGWTDPATRETYYFMAFANGMTVARLTQTDLPALVNAYLLTGNEKYAERALWILDAIATIYPSADSGPIDYPGNKPGRPDGGRLERPYYQAARALVRYAYFYEVLAGSTLAAQKSPSNPQFSMRRNIELNLLMNGADYCLRMTETGQGASKELNNGNIDYNRGPLAVGALLGIPEWVDWALNGPLGFRYAVTNSIDINGRYFETGASYAQHTRELLLSTSELLKRMRLPQYPQGFNAYNDKRFALFALDFFTQMQAAGRLPQFGDAGPDRLVLGEGEPFDKGTLLAAQQFYRYTDSPEIRAQALKTGALMRQSLPEKYSPSEEELFQMPRWDAEIKKVQAGLNAAPQAGSTPNASTLFFDYGTLIFRSGEGNRQRAALMRFGPTLNHGQADELNLQFYAKGREFSFDPGYYNTHLRFGFTSSTVAHNLLVVNRHNQMRQPSPGGDLQTWTDGNVLQSAAVNDATAYADQNVQLYKRRIAFFDISPDDSIIIDNFWARGGHDYDYSLHGISQGKLEIASSPNITLQEKRDGSVLDAKVDYSAEMNANGVVASFAKEEFYFAPPGDGYGFLSKPTFYKMNGPALLQWTASDATNHKLFAWNFAPPNAQLITAQSPRPPATMDVTFALARVSAPENKTVRFTSVILPTSGENKLASVEQLAPQNGASEIVGLRLRPAPGVLPAGREYLYFASDKNVAATTFEDSISFAGEEGFLSFDANKKVQAASLSGAGEIRANDFTFTATPRFTKPLRILEIKDQPLRLLVNAPFEQTQYLVGSIVRLNKPNLARPFSLRVQSSEAAGENSWLTLDASGNTHAVGTVKSFDAKTNTITTDAPFPRARPYLFGYDYETGKSGISNSQESYNGTYNGFHLVNAGNAAQSAVVEKMQNRRTEIILQNTPKADWKPGDAFEIQLYAVGDDLEIPVWSQAKRDANGAWQITGTGIATIKE
jgi:hypothetical protein